MLTDRIIQEAKDAADALVAKAKEDAKLRLETAKREIDQDREAQIERAMGRAMEAAKQAEITAKTLARKNNLRARVEALDVCFAEAAKKVDKTKLAASLKAKFAKPKDTVTPAKEGGIVIENSNYILSLTLPELMAGMRADIEWEVARRLF